MTAKEPWCEQELVASHRVVALGAAPDTTAHRLNADSYTQSAAPSSQADSDDPYTMYRSAPPSAKPRRRTDSGLGGTRTSRHWQNTLLSTGAPVAPTQRRHHAHPFPADGGHFADATSVMDHDVWRTPHERGKYT